MDGRGDDDDADGRKEVAWVSNERASGNFHCTYTAHTYVYNYYTQAESHTANKPVCMLDGMGLLQVDM